MRLRGRVAAITGAGRGIGRSSAELFAREGCRIAILEINEQMGVDAEQTIKQSGGEAVFIKTDVSDAESVRDAFAALDREYGRLDVLYNNASVFLGGIDGPVADLPLDIWHRILGINLNSVFYCCKYGIPLMLRSGGGSIINTSSSAGVLGVPKCDAYTATKGATISLTRSMAVEYGRRNIRVNCIAPCAVRTEMVKESNFNDPDFDEEHFNKVVPFGRWGTPEEVASVALFLASDESSYVNGAVILADGGITVTPPY